MAVTSEPGQKAFVQTGMTITLSLDPQKDV